MHGAGWSRRRLGLGMADWVHGCCFSARLLPPRSVQCFDDCLSAALSLWPHGMSVWLTAAESRQYGGARGHFIIRLNYASLPVASSMNSIIIIIADCCCDWGHVTWRKPVRVAFRCMVRVASRKPANSAAAQFVHGTPCNCSIHPCEHSNTTSCTSLHAILSYKNLILLIYGDSQHSMFPYKLYYRAIIVGLIVIITVDRNVYLAISSWSSWLMWMLNWYDVCILYRYSVYLGLLYCCIILYCINFCFW